MGAGVDEDTAHAPLAPASVEGEVATIRSALVCVLVGAFVELMCLAWFSPGTFVAMACIGLPMTLLGIGIFVRMVWRHIRRGPM